MGREAFGGGDIADARAALPQQTLDLHGLAGQQVDAGTAGSHAGQFGLEGFRILGQHREGAPVHGDDRFAAQQLQARDAWRASMVKTPPMGSRATSMG